MACSRNCGGTPLCQALNLCCLQLRLDCGKECAGVPDGYGSVQLDENGNLLVCVNTGGICECNAIITSIPSDSLVLNLDGSFTHTDVDGNPVVVDICDLLTEAYAQTPWVSLTLDPDWADAVGYQELEYRCLCTGEVQLRGCIEGTPTDGELPGSIATLPTNQDGNSCRPDALLRFGENCAPIEIDTDGSITTTPSLSEGVMRCFNGISFDS